MTVTRGHDTVGVAELKDWVPVGPRGTVEAVTVAHVGLDGADGLLLHRVEAPAGQELEPGVTVEPVFLPQAARKGSILDIQHFRPARSARRS